MRRCRRGSSGIRCVSSGCARTSSPGTSRRSSDAAQGSCGTRPSATSSRRSRSASSSRSCRGQPVQQLPLGLQVVGQRGVQRGPAGVGQRDHHGPPVGLAALAGDQALLLQPVQPLGDRAGGHQRRPHQRRGRELVGLPGPAQGGQDVEGRRVEAVPREGGPLGEVDLPLQLGDPADDAHRRAVEVGSLPAPLLQDLVDASSTSLTVVRPTALGSSDRRQVLRRRCGPAARAGPRARAGCR